MHFGSIKQLLILFIFMVVLSGCAPKASFSVDGMAVSEEEQELLDGNAEWIVRAKQIQKWAAEEGLAEAFSYQTWMKNLKAENRKRAEKKAAGGIVYGVVEYTPLQYYNVTMGEYERLLKESIMKSADEEVLQKYYEENKNEYQQIGEIEARLTIREDGRVMEENNVVVNRYNIREVSERDEMLVAYMIEMEEGGTCTWEDKYGRGCTLVCIRKTEGSLDPYEQVAGAVMAQYANAQFEAILQQKINSSLISDNRA